MPYVIDPPAESSPSSLQHHSSKREKVRKFLRRVSSIGSRHKHEKSLSQTVVVAEAQASGSERDAISPEPHPFIDLTVEPIVSVAVKAVRRDSTTSSDASILKHLPSRLPADDASSFHSSTPSDSSDERSESSKQSGQEPKPEAYVLLSHSHWSL